MTRSTRIAGPFVWLQALALCTVIAASGITSAESVSEQERIGFVAGNLAFVLLHEFGHVVIHDFDIPVLGNEEDAADTLAAVTLIELDRRNPDTDFRFLRTLLTAADANRILWQKGAERDESGRAYWARHPLSVQRAARIACLAYGSNTTVLAALPELVGMPMFRSDWCEEEYQLAREAYRWVRDSVKTREKAAAEELPHKYSYGRVSDEAHKLLVARMKKERVLERALGFATKAVLLPDAIDLRAMVCDSPNAYWDRDKRQLVLCYELVAAFYALSTDQRITELEARLRELNGDGD